MWLRRQRLREEERKEDEELLPGSAKTCGWGGNACGGGVRADDDQGNHDWEGKKRAMLSIINRS